VVVLGFAVSPRGRWPAKAAKRAYTDAGDSGSLSEEHSKHDAIVHTRVMDHEQFTPMSLSFGPTAASEARSIPPIECPTPAKSPRRQTSAMYSHEQNKSSFNSVSKSQSPNPTDRIIGISIPPTLPSPTESVSGATST
jgi:hypothetical protein